MYYYYLSGTRGNNSPRISRNDEAKASDFLEILKEIYFRNISSKFSRNFEANAS